MICSPYFEPRDKCLDRKPLHLLAMAKREKKDQMEDMMKGTPQTYVLRLNSPSRKALRLWTGTSIHTLRHCSVKQLNRALMELQQHMEDLQVSVPAPGASYSLNRSR